jgi:single-strand DNA-binding protein
MSGSLNKVQIIGNLGRDPEIRYTADNKPIANVTVATTDKWKKDGQQQEKTEWHRIVVFGGLAEVVEKYLKKGDSAYFEGKIQTRKWQDNTGNERYTTEIVVDQFSGTMQMLGAPKGAGGYSQEAPSQGYSQPQQAATTMKPAAVTEDAPFDDDIPF